MITNNSVYLFTWYNCIYIFCPLTFHISHSNPQNPSFSLPSYFLPMVQPQNFINYSAMFGERHRYVHVKWGQGCVAPLGKFKHFIIYSIKAGWFNQISFNCLFEFCHSKTLNRIIELIKFYINMMSCQTQMLV